MVKWQRRKYICLPDETLYSRIYSKKLQLSCFIFTQASSNFDHQDDYKRLYNQV